MAGAVRPFFIYVHFQKNSKDPIAENHMKHFLEMLLKLINFLPLRQCSKLLESIVVVSLVGTSIHSHRFVMTLLQWCMAYKLGEDELCRPPLMAFSNDRISDHIPSHQNVRIDKFRELLVVKMKYTYLCSHWV